MGTRTHQVSIYIDAEKILTQNTRDDRGESNTAFHLQGQALTGSLD
jgi:hypothetical protein